MRQIVGCDVRVHMVDAHKGKVASRGKALGEREPHEQGADKAWGAGGRHQADVRGLYARFVYCLAGYLLDLHDVLARGDLGDHPAKTGMTLLPMDSVGKDLETAGDHRGRGLVAGGFNAQDKHGTISGP